MNRYTFYRDFTLRDLCLVLALSSMVACSSSVSEPETSVPRGSAKTYVSLQLSAAGSSRATRAVGTPTPGEEGDGRELGQDYENTIDNLTAFFYADNDGINTKQNPTIVAQHYFDASQIKVSGTDRYTEPVPLGTLQKNVPYRIVVVANAGDLTQNNFTTLDELRQYTYARDPYQVSSAGEYSSFYMTSADGTEKLSYTAHVGSYEDPFTTDKSVALERVAARIDYRDARTSVKTPDGAQYVGSVSITGATIVNRPDPQQHTTYMLKRVSQGTNLTEVNYLGLETTNSTDGTATNYVVDPQTLLKTASPQTDFANYYENYFPTFANDPAKWKSQFSSGTELTGESADYRRIGYTLENTVTADAESNRYLTGIVFEAQFTPEVKPMPLSTMSGYEAGQNFFSFNGILYRSLTQAMQFFYNAEGMQNLWQEIESRTFSTSDTWGDVQQLVATMPLNDPAGYREYLRTQLANHALTDAITSSEGLSWSDYLTTVLGVEEKDGVAEVNQSGIDTRNLLHKAGTRLYESGKCYYTYWVRHADDGDKAQAGIMEHAIVRNNIYKLDISAIRDLGNDIPTDEEFNIVIVVAVKNWKMLDEEVIEF